MLRHPKDTQSTDARTELVPAILIALGVTPNGGEDIVAVHDGEGSWMPLVISELAKPEMIRNMKIMAMRIALESKRTVRVVRFSTREVVETFEG
jgi:hypothetical protein